MTPPEDLAAALRDGLDARRFFRTLPTEDVPPPDRGAFPGLEHFRRVAEYQPPGRSPVLRFARKIARKLLAPWLEQQTEFNEASLAAARTFHEQVERLTARLNQVQRELLPAYRTATARIGECVYDLQRLREAVGPAGESALGLGDRPPADPPAVIEGLFVHTRIGPPPGRVLVAGPGGFHALDLAGLGFQVVYHAAGLGHPSHPGLTVVPDAGGGRLPFEDGTFDRVVVTDGPTDPGFWDEAARVLAPGGRLIASRAGADGPAGPLPVAEAAYAHRAGHGWGLADAPHRDTAVSLWVADRG